MFQQQIEKRRVGSIVFVSVCVHAAIVFLVILHSVWTMDLQAAPIRQLAPIFQSEQPLPIPIRTVSHPPHEAALQNGGGTPGNESPEPQHIAPTLTQQSFSMVSDLQPEPTNSGCDGCSTDPSDNGGNGAGPGTGSGIGDDDFSEIHKEREVDAPILTHKVEPAYPELARKLHIQGVVVMEAVIGLTGRVENIRILIPAHALLTNAATQAVQQWQYQPARLGNKPVRCYVNITVRFTLK